MDFSESGIQGSAVNRARARGRRDLLRDGENGSSCGLAPHWPLSTRGPRLSERGCHRSASVVRDVHRRYGFHCRARNCPVGPSRANGSHTVLLPAGVYLLVLPIFFFVAMVVAMLIDRASNLIMIWWGQM
jgi:hypothetical protein